MKIGFLIISLFLVFLFTDAYAILDPPVNLQVTSVTSSSVTLIWDPPKDISSLIGYKIESRIGSAQYEIIEQNTGNLKTTYSHMDLSENTFYSYRVTAVYENDEVSIPSNEETAYTSTDTEQQVAKDSDGDKIPDNIDDCPLESENYNEFEDSDGCPDNKPAISEGTATSTVGTVTIAQQEYHTDRKTPIVLELSGNLEEFTIEEPLFFAISSNDDDKSILDYTPQTFVKNDGRFNYDITLPILVQDGQYTLQAIYKNEQIGTVTFYVKTKGLEPQISKNPSLEIYGIDQPITFSVINPDYPENAIKIYYWKIMDEDSQVIKPPKNDGSTLNYNFQKFGTYDVKLTVIDNFGNIQHILSDPITVSSNVFQQQSDSIPSWIKNNAEWWAAGQVDDSSFVQGIQYLIQEGIITIPPTAQGSGSDLNEIPSWIKNNAEWWAAGQVDDSSFVQGIQYLIQEGIMTIQS